MNNPLHILETLDRHLTAPTEIILFGRAALALGYPGTRTDFAATRDVDAILSLAWLSAENENQDFWRAQQCTNAELDAEGLYLTHLFRELDVLLRPAWLNWRVRIALGLKHLTVFRPATVDLILTKMARCDDNDLADIRFLLSQEPMTSEQLRSAFANARVPDIAEVREIFRSAQPKVLALAQGK